MITGEIKSQVDRIWDAFWSGGISNPLEVIEQMTYLLFIKRLDELHTAKEKKANRLKQPIERPIFGADQQQLRWSVFRQLGDPSSLYALIADKVFPFIKNLGGMEGSTYAGHMKDARFTIPTPLLLAKVVDMLDAIPMDDRDTKGDLYEYMLGKIASAGQNGQFRTPRHIIKLMVDMMAPKPSDVICDPACGTAGFLVAASEYLLTHHQQALYATAESARRFNHETFHGFDFDNTMLRVGSMNMLLHGVENPAIENRDALSLWSQNLSEDQWQLAIEVLQGMPLAMEVPLRDGSRVGMVHAELQSEMDWKAVESLSFERVLSDDSPFRSIETELIWGRGIARMVHAIRRDRELSVAAGRQSGYEGVLEPALGIDVLISGHSITDTKRPVVEGNRWFIDTGSYQRDGKVTLVEPLTENYWQVGWRRDRKGPLRKVGVGSIIPAMCNERITRVIFHRMPKLSTLRLQSHCN